MAEEMTTEEIRAALIAKIRAAWPRDIPAELESSIELGSNDDLRRYLAFAEVAGEIGTAISSRRSPPASELIESQDEAQDDTGDDGTERTPWPARHHHEPLRELVSSSGYAKANPSFTYLRAADYMRNYDGPEWVPFNLTSVLQSGGHHGNTRECGLAMNCAKALIDSAGAVDLWRRIFQTYAGLGRIDSIASTLPVRCAQYIDRWRTLPKVKPKDHAKARGELGRKAAQLAIELERFIAEMDREDGEGFTFMRLLSEAEREEAYERIRRHNHFMHNKTRGEAGVRRVDYADYTALEDPSRPNTPLNHMKCVGDTGEVLDVIDAIVPPLPAMLRRMGKMFQDNAAHAPLAKPHYRNAERNFFARSLCCYFWTGFGDVSPTIVARIVSIFYDQGITDNEVSQMISKVKRDHPLPPEPIV